MKKEDLKIAVFSSYDKVGGAAIACYNCVKMLRGQGFKAVEIVRYKTCGENFVYQVPVLRKRSLAQRVIDKFFPPKINRDIKEDTDPQYCFYGDESDSPDMCTIEEIENAMPFVPNVIFVGHTYNLVNTTILVELKKKWNCHIYLTCNDVSPYTGGCHVHWDCKGFTTGCEDCPAVLVESRKKEVSDTFQKKRNNIIEGNIGIRYSNNWLKRELQESLMFKNRPLLYTGHNTDTDLYNPFNRDIAKRIFGLSKDSFTLMNGSTYLNDLRKGLSYFCKAMQYLYEILPKEKRTEVVILIVGNNIESVQPLLRKIPNFEVKIIDFITDNRLLSLLYQATDVYVGTSLEDAGPMMVSNSLACGTPVVGFKTGLFDDEEIVQDGVTGYGVEMKNIEMLAERIKDVFYLNIDDYRQMSDNCRKIAMDKLSKYRTLERYNAFLSEL